MMPARLILPGVLRGFLGLLLVCSVLMGCQTVPPRPNIIVFLVDDMGPMDTSVPFMLDEAGSPQRYPLNDYYRTPGMERLAAQGIRLNNFYAMSVCSPTRTSIITGQNATRHGVTQWIRSENNNRGEFGPPLWNWTGIEPTTPTLATMLGQRGYRSIYIGKAHFGPIGEPAEFPTNLGYDINIAGCSWGQPGSYYGQAGYGHISGNASRAVPDLEQYHGTETFLTEALTLQANEQITNAVNDGTPFFLHLAHYALHAPFNSDPRFAPHYEDSGYPRPAQAYATLVEGMDKSLNDVMDHLQELGIAENTLIIFLGDNGSDAPLGPDDQHNSSFPLRGKKATHFEGGIRAPFIAAWASPNPDNYWQQRLPIAQGVVQTQVGTVMDIYPTLLNLVGQDTPDDYTIDGYDLATQLAGQANPDRPERFLMHFPHGHRSSYFTTLRIGDWKVIYHYRNQGAERYELYNLAQDPFEDNDLSAQRPVAVYRMMNEMIQQLESEGALYPVDGDGNEMRPQLPDIGARESGRGAE